MSLVRRPEVESGKSPAHLLVIFAKAPQAGRVKTRLGAVIGMEKAAQLYRGLGRSIVDRLRGGPYSVVLSYAPRESESVMRSWLGTDGLEFWPQEGRDLGQRMSGAFTRAFRSFDRVCLVGTDVPDLDPSHVIAAFDALEGHDVVFGPATDGGYYLVASARPVPELFTDISWTTAAVLSQSEARARKLGLSVTMLGELDDVDTARDLARRPELLPGCPPPRS